MNVSVTVQRDTQPALNPPLIEAQREFESLYRRWRPILYSTAYRALGNATDAEDITQEAFMRAWRRFSQYDRTHRFGAWIDRILRNLIIDRYRKQKRAEDLLALAKRPEDAAGAGLLSLGSRLLDPPSQVEEALVLAAAEDAVASLPVRYRKIVKLAVLDNLPYADVAALANCPVGTVKSRVYRARRLLRSALAEFERN